MRLRTKVLAGLTVSCLLVSAFACRLGKSHSFEYQGDQRSYEVYTPPSLDKHSGKNKPLLLVLHGNPSNGWQMRLYSGMNKVARKGDFIAAYPNAASGKWPITDAQAIANETGYINAMIDDIIRRYPVDTNRIYTSGISGGGIFSFILADRMPERFAAMAVVAGNLPVAIEQPESIRPIPLALFHGTGDFLYNGRPDLMSVSETIQTFQKINSCSSTPAVEMLENKKNDDTSVELLTFDCPTPLLFYKIENGGHHWPGGSFNADRFTKLELGEFCRDIDASRLIWEFVSEHRK